MRDLECLRADACRDLCDAIAAQGLAIRVAGDECAAPGRFSMEGDEIAAEFAGYAGDEVLAGRLVSTLYTVLQQGERHRPDVEQLVAEHTAVLAAQTAHWSAMIGAAKAGRTFTPVENQYYQEARDYAASQLARRSSTATAETVVRAQAAFDNRTLTRDNLVYDDQAVAILDRLVGNYLDGRPTLLVGDKGVAKTQLAQTIARLASDGRPPIFISGHGDQMSDEFIGRQTQDPESGLFTYKEGKLVDAMRLGLPVVIDEANLTDQAIIMRLQDILLRRPGDTVTLGEDGDAEITIAPGFVVFATANEASERYRHRVSLDPAFRDRFDIIEVAYPDSTNKEPLLELPQSTYRLALAAATDKDGTISPYIPMPDLELLARLAHVTQRLYSVPLERCGINFNDGTSTTTNFLAADKPAMTDCITPRTMVTTLRRLAKGNKPGMDLNGEIERLINSLDQAGARTNAAYAEKVITLFGSSH